MTTWKWAVGLLYVVLWPMVAAGATTHTAADWSELVAANTAAADGDTIILTGTTYTQPTAAGGGDLSITKSLTFQWGSADVTIARSDASFSIVAQAGGTTQTWSGDGTLTLDKATNNGIVVLCNAQNGHLTVDMTRCRFMNSGNAEGIKAATPNATANNVSLTLRNCEASNNGTGASTAEDGFSIAQGTTPTGTATLTCIDCIADENGDNGFTNHANTTLFVTRCSAANNIGDQIATTGANSVATITDTYCEQIGSPVDHCITADSAAVVTLRRCRVHGNTGTAKGLTSCTSTSTLTAYDCDFSTAGGDNAGFVYTTGPATFWDCRFTTTSAYGAVASYAPFRGMAGSTLKVYRCTIDAYATVTSSTNAMFYIAGAGYIEGNAIVNGDIEDPTTTRTHYCGYFAATGSGAFIHNTLIFRETAARPIGVYLLANNVVVRGNLMIKPYWGVWAGTANYYDGVAGSGYNVILGSLSAPVYGDTAIGTDVTTGTAPTFRSVTPGAWDFRLATRGVAADLVPVDAYQQLSYELTVPTGWTVTPGTYDREEGDGGAPLDAGAYTDPTSVSRTVVLPLGGDDLWLGYRTFSGIGGIHRTTGSYTGETGVHKR